MSKKANKTLIGAFVAGAVALLVIGIAVFGSGTFLAERVKFVMYFDGSVKGLNVGSPMVFRGVKVGSVTDIQLQYDPETVSIRIPVIVELEPERLRFVKERKRLTHKEGAKRLVERGLRAQLQVQSMVTGQLMVELDFRPDEPARLVGGDSEYPEIPTIPSPMQQLSQTLERLPLEDLVVNLTSAIQGIDNAVNSPEFTGAIQDLHGSAMQIRELLTKMNEQFDDVAVNVDGAVGDIRTLVRNADGTLESVGSAARDTTEAASAAMKQFEITLKRFEEKISERSPLNQEVIKTLGELRAAARSLRVMADYLERHPESLLQGKGGDE